MRTMIGKRIGPVPIALVAVLALAAFISAGLWLMPNNGAQAAFLAPDNAPQPETAVIVAKGSIADVVLDVGEDASTAAIEMSTGAELFTIPSGVTATYTVTQSGTADNGNELDGIADSNFDAATGYTIPATVSDAQDDAGKSSTITITATGDETTPTMAKVSFKITVLQNPIEQSGVMVTNPDANATDDGIQYPGAVACEVSTTGTALTTPVKDDFGVAAGSEDADDDPELISLTGGGILVSGGACITTKDSLDVTFKNTGTEATAHVVYVTGGSKFKKVMPDLAKDGLDEHTVVIPAQTASVGLVPASPGEKMMTISKSMASKGMVYVVGYADEADKVNKIGSDSVFKADAEFVVKVTFLEAPDAGKSTVESGAKPADSADFAASEELDDSGTARVQVSVKDKNNTAVEGVTVDFRLVDADSAIKFSNERQILLSASDADGMAMADVMGLEKTGATRVGVEVSIGGGDIKRMVHLIRKGDPAMVHISGYADCNKDDGCAEETAEMPIVKSTGGSFFIRAIATDSAMNYLTKAESSLMVEGYDDASDDVISIEHINTEEEISMWWEALDCPLMNDVVMPMGNEPAVGPDNTTSPYCKHYPGTDFPASSILSDAAKAVVDAEAMRWYEVTVNDDAKPAAEGMSYAVKATAGTGSDKVMSDKVGFAVLGGIDMLALAGPERLGTSQIVSGFSVTATAKGGGVPGNIKGQMVSISFAPDDAASVVGTAGDTKNKVELDAMGLASFSILVTPSRLGDDNLIVIASNASGDVISDPLEVMHRQVSTGPTNSAPRAVGSITDFSMTLGDAPVTVNAGFADADGDTLGYSASSSDDTVATATSNGGGSVTVTAVGEGTATITVTASDGQANAEQSFMVTVSAPVDMTLGTASGLTATGGDGQVTLSWNPGMNATMYYVAGVAKMADGTYDYTKNVWMYGDLPAADENGMVSITVTNHSSESSDGMSLVNGTAYTFTVLSARMMDGMVEWTDWAMPFATATPMAAGSGGSPGSPFG